MLHFCFYCSRCNPLVRNQSYAAPVAAREVIAGCLEGQSGATAPSSGRSMNRKGSETPSKVIPTFACGQLYVLRSCYPEYPRPCRSIVHGVVAGTCKVCVSKAGLTFSECLLPAFGRFSTPICTAGELPLDLLTRSHLYGLTLLPYCASSLVSRSTMANVWSFR